MKDFDQASHNARNIPIYLFRESWRWTKGERKLIEKELIPPTLHIPNGSSRDGELCIDIGEPADIKADMNLIPLRARSFNTILSDPPWINPRKWDTRWLKEFARIARKKIILRSGQWFYTIPKPWVLTHTWFVLRIHNAMINHWHVWELLDGDLNLS